MTDHEDHDGDDYDPLLPEYRAYITRFPDVGSALAAARRGEETSRYLHGDGARNLMTVTPYPAGPGGLVEFAYYLEYWDALDTAVRNALGDGGTSVPAVMAAAVSWIQQAEIAEIETLPGGSLKAVALMDGVPADGGSRPPLIAVLERLPVAGTESWDALESGAYGKLSALNEAMMFGREPTAFLRSLALAGARLIECSECGQFLTNGLAEFPGVWFDTHEFSGAICGSWSWPPSPHHPVPWQDNGEDNES